LAWLGFCASVLSVAVFSLLAHSFQASSEPYEVRAVQAIPHVSRFLTLKDKLGCNQSRA